MSCFKINDSETISKMFTCFTNIINSIKAVSRNIPNVDLVNKYSDRF